MFSALKECETLLNVKTFLFSIGILSLALGLIGIFTPLLPTTPLILLAGYCFSKSSDKFHAWLINHRVFGEIIRSWERDRAIPLKAKVFAILMLLFSGTVIFLHQRISEITKGFVLVFLFVVVVFILSRPSQREKSQ